MQERHVGKVTVIYGRQSTATIEDCITGKRYEWDFSSLLRKVQEYGSSSEPEHLETVAVYTAALIDHDPISFVCDDRRVIDIGSYQPNMDEAHAQAHEVTVNEARELCEKRLRKAS